MDVYRRDAIHRRNKHFIVELSPLRDEMSNERSVKIDLTPIRYRFADSRSSFRYNSPTPKKIKKNSEMLL